MKEGIRSIVFCYWLLISLQITVALQTHSLGIEDGWQDGIVRNNITIREVEGGRSYLELEPSVLAPDAQTEFLLPFDEFATHDASGNYRILSESRYAISSQEKKQGSGSALFRRGEGLRLQAEDPGMFFPQQVGGDFTIEFWLLPHSLQLEADVFLWTAREIQQTGERREQKIRIYIENGRLYWDFDNVFQSPDRVADSVSGGSQTVLVPQHWQHHMLRYESEKGHLEYSVDLKVQQISHIRGQDEYVFFRMEDYQYENFVIGRYLVGALDNFRISTSYRSPEKLKLVADHGSIVSHVYDTGSLGAQLHMIESDFQSPKNAQIVFQYRMADSIVSPDPETSLATEWQDFIPGRGMSSPATGRYVQCRVIFFSDPELQESPVLRAIQIHYYPNSPVLPPRFVQAETQGSAVLLEWSPVYDSDLAGYEVYYGLSVDNFHGVGSAQGDSPIFVPEGSSLLIEGLGENNLYYFALVSRSRHGTVYGNDVRFSPIVSARPLLHR